MQGRKETDPWQVLEAKVSVCLFIHQVPVELSLRGSVPGPGNPPQQIRGHSWGVRM